MKRTIPNVARSDSENERESAVLGSNPINKTIITPNEDNAEDRRIIKGAQNERKLITTARKQETGNPTKNK